MKASPDFADKDSALSYKSAHANVGASANTPASVRRGPWLPDEDRRLMAIIAVQGPTNWVRILTLLGSRLPKQCRERYHQNLKPSLNRNPITAEEGMLIEQLVAKHGKKWAEIARHLTGRSDNAIKNWWNGGANRRRRVSHVAALTDQPPSSGSASSQTLSGVNSGYSSNAASAPNSAPVSAPVSNSGSFSHQSMPQYAHLRPNLTQSVSPQASRHNSMGAAIPPDHQVTHYPKVPQFPQILFNTSMFSELEKRTQLNGAHSHSHSHGHLPHLHKSPIRLASIDHPTLPPLLSNFNKRMGEEDRRYSLNAANLPPTTLPALYLQQPPHLAHNNTNLPTQGVSNSSHGGDSSHYSLPVSYVSRQNSLSHDYKHSFVLPLATSSAHPLRRSSVAPDLFSNPMAGHGVGDMWMKRNQLLILLHSPSIMPINSNPHRLSVSSALGLLDHGKPPSSQCNAGSSTVAPSAQATDAAASTLASGSASGIPSYKNLLRSINSTPIPEDNDQDAAETDRIKVLNLIE